MSGSFDLNRIEISRSALFYNLKNIRQSIKKNVSLFAVVKSNAYGHGMETISKLLEKKVEGFCVANTDEALNLRQISPNSKIIAITYFTTLERSYIRLLAKKGIEVPIASFETLRALCQAKIKISGHIKIDTGTTRIGFLKRQIPRVIEILTQNPFITISGIYSHFSEAENIASNFTEHQLALFNDCAEQLKNQFPKALRHIACSAAINAKNNFHLDAVRPGIHMYGLSGLSSFHNIRPVMSVTSHIIQLKSVPSKTTIGYNRTFTTKKKSLIAIIPFGYYEGLPRFASNKGFMLIHGKKAPIRGRVCMNLTMVDCSNITNVHVGDEVTIFGNKKALTATTVATWGKTINYEIVSRINPFIKRILV